jgi:hypothetical protein
VTMSIGTAGLAAPAGAKCEDLFFLLGECE